MVTDDFPCCAPDGEHGHDYKTERGWVASEDEPQPRAKLLREAEKIITGDRQASYGDATESFNRLAALWTATLGTPVTAAQVALCLIQLKVSRLTASPDHADSWLDIAGYAALGGEITAGA